MRHEGRIAQTLERERFNWPTRPPASFGWPLGSRTSGWSQKTTKTIGLLPAASSKWAAGGILAPNGCMYFISRSTTTILKLDVEMRTLTTFGTTAGNIMGQCTLAPNGCIYCPPSTTGTSIMKVDTNTDTISFFGTISAGAGWSNGILAPNGFLYFTPSTGTSTVLKIDPSNDTFTTFGSLSGSAYAGLMVADNNCLYGLPFNAGNALKIDPQTDTITTFGSYAGGTAAGCSRGPDHCLYSAPQAALVVTRLDPRTDTFTTFGSASGSNSSAYRDPCWMPDGTLVCAPQGDVVSILVIDPVSGTTSTFGWSGGTPNDYVGGALAHDGSIYCTPFNATTMLVIGPRNSPIPLQHLLNRRA